MVNNTRFTDDALQYGNCAGLKLIGWDYPKQGSLKDMINISGLHPITCLTTLNKHEKNKLLEKDLVLSAELHLKPELLNEIGISEKRHRKILEEARELCGVE
ncbi:MAG: hypothetical protein WD048_07615 [Chitinophagales bacterium]